MSAPSCEIPWLGIQGSSATSLVPVKGPKEMVSIQSRVAPAFMGLIVPCVMTVSLSSSFL